MKENDKGGDKAAVRFKELKQGRGSKPVAVEVRHGIVRIRELVSQYLLFEGRTISVIELFADSDTDCHFKIYGLPDSDDPLGHVAQIISEHGAKVTEVRR